MARSSGSFLVVGADGAIGGELVRRLAAADHDVIGTTRRVRDPDGRTAYLDLAGDPDRWELPGRVRVAYLCAAVTSVERCRTFPVETRRINVERTLDLAARLRARGAHVVFLSTNLALAGTGARQPADAAGPPATEYGRQKREVEDRLLAAGGATVVRLTKVYGPEVELFRKWAALLAEEDAIHPFRDLVLAPVPLGFTAGVLARVGERPPGGVVQVSAERDVSYAQVGRRLANVLGADPGLVREVAAASRGIPPEEAPAHTTLDVGRLTAEFGLTPPPAWDTIDTALTASASRFLFPVAGRATRRARTA